MVNNYKVADLHIHTTASDGNTSPVELVNMARENGLYAVAITDHDILQGVKDVLNGGIDYGIELISGVEVSVSFEPIMHVLGLFVDSDNEELNHILAKTCNKKKKLLAQAIQTMSRNGIEINMMEIKKRKISSLNGLIKYMLELNIISSVDEGKTFFGSLYSEWKSELPDPEKCFEMIHRAGGVVILAHPLFLGISNEDLKTLLLQLKRIGLDGIEINHPDQSEEYRNMLRGYAEELDFLTSGGSDYHGKNNHAPLSTPDSNTVVPYEVVEKMKRKIESYKNDIDTIYFID